MADEFSDRDVLRDLLDQAATVAQLAKNEKSFTAAYEAFRSEDRKGFQAVLKRLKLIVHCHLVCEWIRVKECVFLCLRLCGPPPVERAAPKPRPLAEAIVRVTSDEKLVRLLAQALEKRDRAAFQKVVKAAKIDAAYCHLFCHWACFVRYRLVCRWLCELELRERPDLALELQAAGHALRQLLEQRKVFDEAATAAQAGDAEKLRGIVDAAGLFQFCYFICLFFCSWRCVLVCLTLCRQFPLKPVDQELPEALEFGRTMQRLADEPQILERLNTAVGAGDARTFAAVLKEFKLERFCIQLCHWICFLRCRRFCFLVCPPIFNHPWFTHVGDFDIYGDFDSGGLTNKAHGHGGPGFGFFGCLSLRGFCPKTSPAHPGEPLAYRFVFDKGGTPIPITDPFVCEVLVGSRYITWDADGTGLKPTLQSVRIRGTSPSPDPTPFPGPAPMGSPPDHYIVPDSEGWIKVDQNALDDGFNGWLMGFASHVAVPGGTAATSVSAGTAVPGGEQKQGTNGKIIFEATRVSQIGVTTDYTNQLAKIHINNWEAVMLLDLLQFHTSGGTPCSPLSTDLDIEYTTDHELMRSWSVGLSTAATIPPPAPTFPSGTGPRGGNGIDHHDISTWPTCSYTVTLTTVRSLTTGLAPDDSGRTIEKTFCIGVRRRRPDG